MKFYTSLLFGIFASGYCQTVAAFEQVPETTTELWSVAPSSENGTENFMSVALEAKSSENGTEQLSNDTDTFEDLDLKLSTTVSVMNGTEMNEEEGIEVDNASLLVSPLLDASLSSVEEAVLDLRTNSTSNEMEMNVTISTEHNIDEQLSTESQVEVLDDH